MVAHSPTPNLNCSCNGCFTSETDEQRWLNIHSATLLSSHRNSCLHQTSKYCKDLYKYTRQLLFSKMQFNENCPETFFFLHGQDEYILGGISQIRATSLFHTKNHLYKEQSCPSVCGKDSANKDLLFVLFLSSIKADESAIIDGIGLERKFSSIRMYLFLPLLVISKQ